VEAGTNNRQFRLAARPDGLPGRECWEMTEEAPRRPEDGEALVKVLMLSLDPAMRGWMNDVPSYIPPVGIGEVMRAIGVGQVVESKHPKLAEGDYVTGLFGIQEYATLHGDALTPIDHELAPLATYLNVLGMPGMTAYFGLLDIGKPQEGETVVVSAAAGAVGSVVGQLAKLKGARAVGIAGGKEKCEWLVDELGFDAAIDRHASDWKQQLRDACPNGVDVDFENVGGEIMREVFGMLNLNARVALCGLISEYNADDAEPGPSLRRVLVNRVTIQGFIILDYFGRFPEAIAQLGQWVAEGKVKDRHTIVEGLEKAPDAVNMLFDGDNVGKLIVKV
jgi:NADPH-dependent curcumin reductase CurA